jgi:hypothetical protein
MPPRIDLSPLRSFELFKSIGMLLASNFECYKHYGKTTRKTNTAAFTYKTALIFMATFASLQICWI